MSGTFNWFIVTLSIFIAVYVSYIVVGICTRIAVSQRITALSWTVGGALAMATGIWAMHFIGMLAFTLPIPVYYDITLTALSIIPAICSSAIALYMIRAKRRKANFFIAGILMGFGISGMHYIGMSAMGMGSCIKYSPEIVVLSVVIAIAASNIALFLIFRQIDNNKLKHGFKLLSALIMGVAITGMHYIGVLAANFSPNCVSSPIFGISLERDILLVIVTMTSIFILSITQLLTIIDRKTSEKSFFEAVFKAQSFIGKGLLVLENRKIILINDVLKVMFDINSSNTLELKSLSKSFKPEEFESFYHWVHCSQSNIGDISRQEFSLSTKRGYRILSAALVGFIHGDRVRLLIVTDDITEKRKSEEALNQLNESLEQRVDERTDELGKANLKLNESMEALQEAQSELVQNQKMASLGSLVAGISHEINTPIGIGVTSASSIEEEVLLLSSKYHEGKMKKSDLDHFLEHIQDGCEILVQNLKRASELISSFKQVAVDQTNDGYRQIQLHDYIEEIITSMRPKLKKTLIKFENNIQADVTFYTKPGALYQIISNLIDNSLIHGFNPGDSGSISISSELINDEIKLIYKDTGKGIDESIRAHIFDPFFTTQRGSGGSGLGLNIVYNLVNSTLKGKIKVLNNENNGARFEIFLKKINTEVKDV